jgi:hypothetical protein
VADGPTGARRVGESRLPMAAAVVAAGGLFLTIPPQFRVPVLAHYGYPVLLACLLVALAIGDPGRIDREKPWLRIATTVLVAVITMATAVAALRLVVGILEGYQFGGATELLLAGGVVWVTSVIAFAMWYWHLDSGGPAARANGHIHGLPAFRFPEHELDDPRYADWYPQFVDYLALSFNTGTSFGPTDVSAVRHWSKLWLVAQSGISLALIGLVVARAVNVL